MGKTTEYTTRHGIKLSNAYAKISNPAIQEYKIIDTEGVTQKQHMLKFQIEIFVDEASRMEGKLAVDIQNAATAYDVDSERNIYAQSYDYLKSLPEFADAEDC